MSTDKFGPDSNSNEISSPPPPWLERRLTALDEALRASGHTLTVTEPSDATELTVTFPQGRRPRPKAADWRAAYSRAHYDFEANEQTYVLRVGEKGQAVADLLQCLNASGAAFISAHNPASLQLGPVHNRMADRALKRDLKGSGALVFPGNGGDPAGAWPTEPSLMVVGMDRSQAERLAKRYGQYAMLWIDANGLVTLVELTDLDKAIRYPLKVPPFSWVELGFNWGDEFATLRLTPSEWLRILQGNDFSKTSRSGYDGRRFILTWDFSKGTGLYVNYGRDGGTAYDGKLVGVSITLEALAC
ncbi:hypothetical protein DIC66_03730 [Rhodoferax lacus]|uniref:Uncharacterized protein n=1 Tax=Rhodoferax lacus TaxID=2184758 RepID=A0A3E1REQ5_9BURK|nr:DUF3293 domain-containing protein [Rhodoferax lacus]RFO97849.1 hypothetical protein DIC66_03730 [Rhodoferax lacus]